MILLCFDVFEMDFSFLNSKNKKNCISAIEENNFALDFIRCRNPNLANIYIRLICTTAIREGGKIIKIKIETNSIKDFLSIIESFGIVKSHEEFI